MLATVRSALIWPQPSSSVSCSTAQAVVVARGLDQARLLELGDLLLPQPVDVHRPARDVVLEQLPAALGAVAVGALGEDLALDLDRLGLAERAALGRARDRAGASCARPRAGAGESTCGMTSPARRTMTSSPGRRSLRTMSSSLCSVASLTVTPPTWTGSSSANGCMSPNLPTFHCTPFRRVIAVVGGNFQAIAQRGSRPTTPRRRCSSTSSTLTTTPSISKSSWPRRCSQDRQRATTSSSVVSRATSSLTRKPCPFSHCSASQWLAKADPLGDADAVGPHRQRALARELGVELADRPGGRVARVHEGRQALLGAALVERGEVGQRHVDLAADLEQRRARRRLRCAAGWSGSCAGCG